MSRHDADRLDDITAAIEAIRSHVERGPLSDSLVSDAVRIRPLEIGDAVKSLPENLTSAEPDIRGARSRACATTTVGRSDIDGQGRPFPLLHLRRDHLSQATPIDRSDG